MSGRSLKPPRGPRGGRGERGRLRRSRANHPTPHPPQVDALNSFSTWPKLASFNERHLIDNTDFHPPLDIQYTFNGGASRDLFKAYSRLSSNEKIKSVIDSTNWQHVCVINESRNDQKLVYALMERWRESTHTFHLPLMEVGFTPYDFTCITGLTVGIGDTVSFDDYEGVKSGPAKIMAKMNLFREFFPRVTVKEEEAWIDSDDHRGISAKKLKQVLTREPVPEEDLDEDELSDDEVYFLRCFFLFVMARLWFPNTKDFVPFGLLHTVEDVTTIDRYDWGSAIMACLYYNLDRGSWMGLFDIGDCWWVLQYWYYEVFSYPAPRLANVNAMFYPRITRWDRELIVRGEDDAAQSVSHNVAAYRARLEEASYLTVNANPYQGHPLYARDDVNNAFLLSQKRHVLGGGEWFTWYLGERLWPQLNGQCRYFGIPYPPPSEMHVLEALFLQWRRDGSIPVDGGNLRADCDIGKWLEYWNAASLGPVLGPRYRTTNNEYVNAVAGQHYDLLPERSSRVGAPPGPVATTQYPTNLYEYYTPDYLEIPGGDPIQFQPQPVDIPLQATNFAWREMVIHEKGHLGATREHIRTSRADYDRVVRRRARERASLESVIQDFGHLLPPGYGLPEHSNSSGSRDGDHGGEAGCSRDYNLDEDE